MKFISFLAAIAVLSSAHSSQAQEPATAVALLNDALSQNVLATEGTGPFRAVLDITPGKGAEDAQHGHIEIRWAAPQQYILDVQSPSFQQHRVVSGTQVEEQDKGDYEPVWLQYFVRALLNPFDRADEIRKHPNAFADNAVLADTCYAWDSRRNLVLNDENSAKICFSKHPPSKIYTLDYTHFLEISDFQSFGKKNIARHYTVSLRNSAYLEGQLTVLETWKPDAALLAITAPTSPESSIETRMLSTAEGTTRIKDSPAHFDWPVIREGPQQGNVLVHVVTDRAGEVREAVAAETDNEEMRVPAAAAAKQYKFQPLLVDGVPIQMDIPLVVAFHASGQKSLMSFTDADTRRRVSGCSLPTKMPDPASHGQTIQIEMLINPEGKLDQIGSSDRKISPLRLLRQFKGCRFEPYKEDGKAVSYRANFAVEAQ